MTQQQNKKIIFFVVTLAAVLAFTPTILNTAFADETKELGNGFSPTPESVTSNNGITLQHTPTEHTVKVPFEVTGFNCETGNVATVFICVFYAGDIEAVGLVENVIIDDVEISLPPEWDPELNGTVMEEVKEVSTLSTYEQQILDEIYKLEERGITLSSTEMETKLLLEDPPELCDFGTEHGFGIQDKTIHELRQPDFEIAKNIDYASNQINRHYDTLKEACDGWDKAKIYQLGVERLHVIKAAQDAFDEEEARIAKIMALSFNYDGPATQHDLDNEHELANKAFCESKLYGNHTKANYGCLNIGEEPNRGGYTNPLLNPIYQQFLKFQETGIAIVNPDITPRQFVSPSDSAKNYLKVYGHIPDELAKPLTAEQLAKIYADYAASQEVINATRNIPIGER